MKADPLTLPPGSFDAWSKALAYVGPLLGGPRGTAARSDLMDLQVWLCAIHAADQLPDDPAPYSPTDPSTWTRAQLVAEVEARMGLRAPEGWAWGTDHEGSGCMAWLWGADEESGIPAAVVQVDGELAWLDEWREPCATLTGPGGAFAAAEKAAGVTRG